MLFAVPQFNRGNPRSIGHVLLLRCYNDHVFDETQAEMRRDQTKSDHGAIVAIIKVCMFFF